MGGGWEDSGGWEEGGSTENGRTGERENTRLLIFGGDMTTADRCVKKSEETLNRLKTLQPKLWDDVR